MPLQRAAQPGRRRVAGRRAALDRLSTTVPSLLQAVVGAAPGRRRSCEVAQQDVAPVRQADVGTGRNLCCMTVRHVLVQKLLTPEHLGVVVQAAPLAHVALLVALVVQVHVPRRQPGAGGRRLIALLVQQRKHQLLQSAPRVPRLRSGAGLLRRAGLRHRQQEQHQQSSQAGASGGSLSHTCSVTSALPTSKPDVEHSRLYTIYVLSQNYLKIIQFWFLMLFRAPSLLWTLVYRDKNVFLLVSQLIYTSYR